MNSTSLPPATEIYDNLCVKIINLPLNTCEIHKEVNTTLNIKSVGDGVVMPVVATLYRITDKAVGEYLPSKVWYTSEHGITLLYYVSPTLPKEVRPFKPGKSYALVVPLNHVLDVIDYDAELRLLIDQVETPSGLSYLIMFTDDVYDKIIV